MIALRSLAFACRDITAALRDLARMPHACRHCGSLNTRRNRASPVARARLCDDCGARWRP